ncbi:GNAT family N-acetyltransferase [Nocardia sp. CDC186]|uniref:GNAT family N-acetyltransferase n=1 Tax=Nocardia implantans TaxID=3108168 RepID=A0ABU6AZ47_9NOCA|nr:MULTISPECIES: GNAT family N-acetyltransferase [unclassified Nocardia]MBF6194355.1 GNAT family N-acetyltransferase [Nocardia beijingensis]MEA3529964.1 GNAT family N-acetyltransferase [Nocardia sp. CDC192]MEB3512558.1 GNAT family N-acetyltransferase [Nocardia sp. CDC186]
MNLPDVDFRHVDAVAARELRPTVEDIYRRSYVDAIASGDPFDAPDQFMHRFDSYTNPAGASVFAMVIAYVGGIPAGQTWGWTLRPDATWWRNFQPDDRLADPDTFTAEDGARTFALSEIMVCAEYTGRGLARSLHDTLLCGRPERRATLLVEPENERAYRAYLRWGWSRVGVTKPSWPDAPVFDVLIRELG